jgi:hypothetical protein
MAHIEGEKCIFPRIAGFLALGGWLANNAKMGYIDLTLYVKIGYNNVLLWGNALSHLFCIKTITKCFGYLYGDR